MKRNIHAVHLLSCLYIQIFAGDSPSSQKITIDTGIFNTSGQGLETRDSTVNFMNLLYDKIVNRSAKGKSLGEFDVPHILTKLFQENDKIVEEADEETFSERTSIQLPKNADTAISFIAQDLPRSDNKKNRLYFSLHTDYNMPHVTLSELFIHHQPNLLKQNRLKISIHCVGKDRTDSESNCEKDISKTRQNSWLIFNVTEIVNTWIANPKRNQGLLVTVTDANGNLVDTVDTGLTLTTGIREKCAFLIALFQSYDNEILYDNIQMDNTQTPREKRSLNLLKIVKSEQAKQILRDRQKLKQKKRCSVKNVRISFSELKLSNWIYAPSSFEANICEGDCSFPMTHNINTTDHALIQGLQNVLTNGEYPAPCCAPHEMSPLALFIKDSHDNYVIKRYSNMIVDSCGCF